MLACASRRLAKVAAPSLVRRSSPACTALSSRSFHASSFLKDDLPPHTVVGMPALSPTMEQGNLSEWYLAEGESFSAGDAVAKIETDKASMDFEAQDDGTIAKILVPAGTEDVVVGTPVMVTVEEEEDAAAFANYVLPESESALASEPAEPPAAAAPVGAPTVSSTPNPHALLPSARFLSESKGLDATGLQGTGKGGRITKGDVLLAIQNGVEMPPLQKAVSTPAVSVAPAAATAQSAAPAAAPALGPMGDIENLEIDTNSIYEDVPNNNMRKVIARRLTESKAEVPHFYTSMEVELDNVLALRKELVSKHEIKVSVNDLIIRCCSLALRDVPEANGTYDPKTDSVKLQDSIDVSVAVATPTGLITPIVPNTDQLGLSEITSAIRDLAGRARDGKLQPHEYQGGTFCVSNLGMFGIDEFSAVINPPQAAILAVGGGTRRVVPTPYIDGAEEQPKPSIKTIMTARLSADRRVVDEPTASLFMSAFQRYINTPELLLL